jgi:transposase
MDKRKQSKIETACQYFPREFKVKIIEEYLQTGQSKGAIEKRYGIKGHASILKWMRSLGYINLLGEVATLSKKTDDIMSKAKKGENLESSKLEERIKELEKQLEDERLRSESYRRMIEIAEKQHNIPIRKNFNTK